MSTTQQDPPLSNYHAVVSAFRDFLTVAIHTILYERDIYPRTSFLKARKYNYPVRQSRHPKVCKWIQDAVAAVEVEMLKCTIASTSLIILSPPPLSTPLERYAFQTSSFPQIPPSEQLTPFESPLPPSQNLPVQFAATISRLSTLSATLAPLPPDCSFTLVVELREDSDALIGAGGSSQSWIAADRSLQRRKGEGREGGGLLRGGEGRRTGEEEDGWVREEVVEERAKREQQQQQQRLGGVDEADGGPTDPLSRPAHPRTTPVRNVEAGAFVMEVWVEEGPDKAAAIAAHAADEARKERERERR